MNISCTAYVIYTTELYIYIYTWQQCNTYNRRESLSCKLFNDIVSDKEHCTVKKSAGSSDEVQLTTDYGI